MPYVINFNLFDLNKAEHKINKYYQIISSEVFDNYTSAELVACGAVLEYIELTQKNYEVFFPRLEFCTDNGAMIAFAGAMRLETSLKHDLGFSVKPRWQLA